MVARDKASSLEKSAPITPGSEIVCSQGFARRRGHLSIDLPSN